MRRLVAAALAGLAITGCGATRVAVEHAEHTTREPEQVGGVRVLVVRRPLGDTTALGLWIDAGSLDGPNATTALVAAEIAAEVASARGGRRVEAVVLPDGTALRVACPRAELAGCLDDLAAGLAVRDVGPETFERAVAGVRQRRERGLGAPRRAAETLAAGAALGLTLSPLGDAEDVTRLDDVRAQLAAHFGASRALLVVVGELDAETLAPHLDSLARVHASEPRSARSPSDGPRLIAEETAGPTWCSLAVRLADRAAALGTARAWSRRGALVGGVSTAAFPTRAGWLALMTFDAATLDPRVAADWLRAPPTAGEATLDEDAWSLVDREGGSWIAGAPAAAPWRAGAGIVGVVPEEIARELDDRLRGGARAQEVVVRAVPGVDDVAAAWALAGPSTDGAALHGATAIAARIFARRCATDASVDVEADAVLVTLRGEPAHVRSEAAFWRDCVRTAVPTIAEIEDARREEMAAHGADDARRALVAERLAPAAPGAVAPRASVSALASVPIEDVRARWATWGESSRLALAGDVATLGEIGTGGAAASARAPVATPGDAAPVRRRIEHAEAPEVLISVALPGCTSGGAARSLLSSWARAARASGARVVWADAGQGGGLAWLALSARGDEQALARVSAMRLDASARALAVTQGLTDEQTARALARADLRRLARDAALGDERAEGTDPGPCAAAPQVHVTWLDPGPSAPRRKRSGPR